MGHEGERGGGGGKREGGLNKGLYPKFQPLTLLHPILQAKHAFVPPLSPVMLNHVLKKKYVS